MVLPRLAAVRQRDQAGRLQLVERGEQFVHRGRLPGDAGLLECRLRIPDPGRHVDIDRHRVVVALDLDDVADRLRQRGVPVLRFGDVVDVVQHALFDHVEELLGGVELRRGRRIAAGHSVDRHGARLLAAGNRGIDPDAAGGAIGVGQLLDGGRFAARGPPVNDFRFWPARVCRAAGAERQRQSERQLVCCVHLISLCADLGPLADGSRRRLQIGNVTIAIARI